MLYYHVAGHTNSFHIQTQTPLAQRYNDNSVMENHHCALTFAIMAKRDCAILSHLEKPLRQVFPCLALPCPFVYAPLAAAPQTWLALQACLPVAAMPFGYVASYCHPLPLSLWPLFC